ncbi:MAG: biopolymer transporter ExbD [Rikenellaceae bacterium]|nr:biopolymer transporter ExbD [Rikenellaceae bacterium]
MASRKIQEINAGSMADIAFLLLIFFLVATTMNVDSGIQRLLPPMQEEDVKPNDVKERNILLVFVSKANDIMVGGKRMDISQLKDEVKRFVSNPANEEDLPEKKEVSIPLLGLWQVSEGVVSLQNDRATTYEMYIRVQNELTRAFNELRDEVSMAKFNKKFMELSDEQRDAVQKAVPLRISEAEPRNTTGGK